jgi:hypothetical protein
MRQNDQPELMNTRQLYQGQATLAKLFIEFVLLIALLRPEFFARAFI